jgi:adenylate cyclase class 2
MNEKEVKVLNIDKEEIERKLIAIGAVLLKDEEQTNLRFDTDDNFLKNKYNGYLRIRITKNLINGEVKNTMTFKRSLSRDKFRENEEIETEISDFSETVKILELLGYKKKNPGFKHRKSYGYEDIIFEIDTWDKETYAKPYLEIELHSGDDLEKAIKLLDLDRSQVTTKSISELRKE